MVDQETLRKAITELLPVAKISCNDTLSQCGIDVRHLRSPVTIALDPLVPCRGDYSVTLVALMGDVARHTLFGVSRDDLEDKGKLLSFLKRELKASGDILAKLHIKAWVEHIRETTIKLRHATKDRDAALEALRLLDSDDPPLRVTVAWTDDAARVGEVPLALSRELKQELKKACEYNVVAHEAAILAHAKDLDELF